MKPFTETSSRSPEHECASSAWRACGEQPICAPPQVFEFHRSQAFFRVVASLLCPVVLRAGRALRGVVEPQPRLGIALRNSAAQHVEAAKVVGCRGVALSGGLAIPFRGCRIILLHSKAVLVEHSQIVLGLGKALHRGLAKQLRRLCIVVRNALAQTVSKRKVELRGSQALSRRFAIPADCGRIIPRNSYPMLVERAELVLRQGEALLGGFAVPGGG